MTCTNLDNELIQIGSQEKKNKIKVSSVCKREERNIDCQGFDRDSGTQWP